jgi:PiT family inorganic phosphate transporter
VHWPVARNIVIGWVLTLPGAALVAAAVYGVIDVLGGGEAGVIIVAAAAVVAASLLWRANRAQPIDPEDTVSQHPVFGREAPQPEAVAA